MKVKELRELINSMPENCDDNEVRVVVKRNVMGGTPTVKVKSMEMVLIGIKASV